MTDEPFVTAWCAKHPMGKLVRATVRLTEFGAWLAVERIFETPRVSAERDGWTVVPVVVREVGA